MTIESGGIVKQFWKHSCNQCGHEWTDRLEHPRMCPNPKCASSFWDRDVKRQRYVKHCLQCGHDWTSFTELPRQCAGCGSGVWNRKKLERYCMQCGHKWMGHAIKCAMCPRCTSRLWNKKDVRKLRKCHRCGHEWKSWKETTRYCHKCHSPHWDDRRKTRTYHCKQCESNWESRDKKPSRCSKCHSHRWNSDSYTYDCRRCRRPFKTFNKRPFKCPLCLSRDWSLERLQPYSPHSRKKDVSKIAKRLHSEQKGRCYYCRTPINKYNYEIDHKIPRSRGGSNDDSNKCMACVSCNKNKNDLTAKEYSAELGLYGFSRWLEWATSPAEFLLAYDRDHIW